MYCKNAPFSIFAITLVFFFHIRNNTGYLLPSLAITLVIYSRLCNSICLLSFAFICKNTFIFHHICNTTCYLLHSFAITLVIIFRICIYTCYLLPLFAITLVIFTNIVCQSTSTYSMTVSLSLIWRKKVFLQKFVRGKECYCKHHGKDNKCYCKYGER